MADLPRIAPRRNAFTRELEAAMSDLRFEDLRFEDSEGNCLPRSRPAHIIELKNGEKRVICDSRGYAGNALDLYQSMQPENARPWPRGLHLPWHWLHPLLVPSHCSRG